MTPGPSDWKSKLEGFLQLVIILLLPFAFLEFIKIFKPGHLRQNLVKIHKPALAYIGINLLIGICFFSASYFFNRRAESPLNAIPYLLVSLIFWIRKPIVAWKKLPIILSTFLIGAIFGSLLVYSTQFLPGSKQQQHDYVMKNFCRPAILKYYGMKGSGPLPPSALDQGKNGHDRWDMQLSECEDNVVKNKGAVFSENPPGFLPVKSYNHFYWYTSAISNYDIKYPEDRFLSCNAQGDVANFNLYKKRNANSGCFEGEEIPFLQLLVNPVDLKTINTGGCYEIIEKPVLVNGMRATRFTNKIINEKGSCIKPASLARYEVNDVFERQGTRYAFHYWKNSDLQMINEIISTMTFTNP